jgi:hypothetical protein
MASQVWLLLLRGGRLDTSKHGRFTVNASLRWPMPTSDRQGRFWFGWFRGVSCRTPSETVRNFGPGSLSVQLSWGLLLSSSCNVPLIVPRPRNTHRRVAGATRQTASAKSDNPCRPFLLLTARSNAYACQPRPRSSYPSRFSVGEPKCHIRPSRAEVPHQAFVAPMMSLDPFNGHAVVAPWRRPGYSNSTMFSPMYAPALGGVECRLPPPSHLCCSLPTPRSPYLHDAKPPTGLWCPPNQLSQVSSSCIHADCILACAPTPPHPGIVGTARGCRAAAAAVGGARHEHAVAERRVCPDRAHTVSRRGEQQWRRRQGGAQFAVRVA